jgi:hypothetical protein
MADAEIEKTIGNTGGIKRCQRRQKAGLDSQNRWNFRAKALNR